MESITLRPVTLAAADVSQLQQIGRQTFFETFAATNFEENMRAYLADGFAHTKLRAELAQSDSIFYFAEQAGRVIGYLKVNTGPAQTEPQAGNALEIERIYVLQEFHGQHIGQFLYEQAVAAARHAQVDYLWLGVWEGNPRTIRFYQKNGFVAFATHIFRLGEDEQTDIMMKRPLPTKR